MKYDHILLIDDDQDDREIFESAIRKVATNVNFTAVDSAVTALQKLQKRLLEPDLIFLDLNMPVMNGQEFLKLVKSNKDLNPIPVIIFSTSSNFAYINQAKELGAHDYITKPYTFDELVRVLTTIIS